MKFVPTPSNVDISKIRQELEIFGHNLRLKWHFRDSNNTFDKNIFKKKSKFNPKGKDPAIELYLNSLEERLINMSGLRNSYNNLSNNERMAVNDLKKDFSISWKNPFWSQKQDPLHRQDQERYIPYHLMKHLYLRSIVQYH